MTMTVEEKRETHTPGPWYCTFPDETSAGGVYGGEKCVCDIIPKELQVAWDCEEVSTARANARLIAAAPEMHRLLERIANDDLRLVENAVECAMDAREILAKVEGGGA